MDKPNPVAELQVVSVDMVTVPADTAEAPEVGCRKCSVVAIVRYLLVVGGIISTYGRA